jgi:hypothetical protein
VWRDGAIAHTFDKVLEGGINGIILHDNVPSLSEHRAWCMVVVN